MRSVCTQVKNAFRSGAVTLPITGETPALGFNTCIVDDTASESLQLALGYFLVKTAPI